MRKLDITGERYGQLTVIKETNHKNSHNRRMWLCICDCGEMVYKTLNVIKTRKNPACKNCTMEKLKDTGRGNNKNITNLKFGRLTALMPTEDRIQRSTLWMCVCECGNKKSVSVRDLSSGNTLSCGCLQTEALARKNKQWGIDHRGDKHPSWNSNLTKEDREKTRHGVKVWRKSIFTKDNYTCAFCKTKGGKLNAHHLDGWNWCKEKRFDLKNGVTLCSECHNRFHKKYGYGNNTKEQFDEFIINGLARTAVLYE